MCVCVFAVGCCMLQALPPMSLNQTAPKALGLHAGGLGTDLCRHLRHVRLTALAKYHPRIMSDRAPVQAMTGMIFKKLFNQALIVWDHCVYVRERLLWYDTEKAMPFLVRDTLARLHRAAAEVLYAEADLVTPCCATFNVDWEQWLGHAPETIMPVVNGLDFNTVGCSSAWVA